MTLLAAVNAFARVFGHRPTPPPEPKAEAPSHTAPRRYLPSPTEHDPGSPWAQAMARLTPEERAWSSK